MATQESEAEIRKSKNDVQSDDRVEADMLSTDNIVNNLKTSV